MGRDLSFAFFESKTVAENSYIDSYNTFDTFDNVSRHNDYMINGIFTYKSLVKKIKKLAKLLNDNNEYDSDNESEDNDDNVNNSKDIAESINVASKILFHMSPKQVVRIDYD